MRLRQTANQETTAYRDGYSRPAQFGTPQCFADSPNHDEVDAMTTQQLNLARKRARTGGYHQWMRERYLSLKAGQSGERPLAPRRE